MIEVRTVKITWNVETGYCDFGGIGRWESTKESVECDTITEAEVLRNEWVAQGKLEVMHWGEFRPTFDFGLFRIRRNEEILNTEVKGTKP